MTDNADNHMTDNNNIYRSYLKVICSHAIYID